ncbi:MAG: DNA mismatch repair protein MutS [Deltaproteobacteria bacterium]|nr:DNA mismatch repair protein MutS [Deltaproteobacteria bacterium]
MGESQTPATSLTPMLQQYWQVRRQFDDPDIILFFRLGDFYEMFFEDAEAAAPLLDIALTSRNRSDPHPVPLCGVPYHAAEGYIARLLAHGKKVAICDQVEDPKLAKGVVKRAITRVITPGVVWAEDALPPREGNYLAAIARGISRFGFAVIDVTTGDFRATEVASAKGLADEIARFDPREVLVAHDWRAEGFPADLATSLDGRTVTGLAVAQFDPVAVRDVPGIAALRTDMESALPAAAAIAQYLAYIHRGATPPPVQRIVPYRPREFLCLDDAAKRNLELLRTTAGERKGSLLWLLDRTLTPMGGRRMKEWLLFPLCDLAAIRARQDAVGQLGARTPLRRQLGEPLAAIGDIERITGRIVAGEAGPRDLAALRRSLERLPAIRAALDGCTDLLAEIRHGIDGLSDIADLIGRTLVDDPPLSAQHGGCIRDGAVPALDALRRIQREGKTTIARIEAQERQRTGIASLKVRFNKVFGYYIEITHTHRAKVPAEYIRKQTLTNAERYITPELKTYEEQVLTAEERIRALESEAFADLRARVAGAAARLRKTATAIATLDVLRAFAELAQAHRYCRPELVDAPCLRITAGRHPVIEQLAAERFVPNDCALAADAASPEGHLLVITGPNMAGKSTVMRQAALITLMAHMGAYVPAAAATVGLTDRIFTRVGAADHLTRGQSTFMVEMAEAAAILREATARCLVIIDEIGRGTSTYDGLAIAWAVAEWLHDRVRARTLFATHYHELADLALTKPGARNYTMAVQEYGERIVFLRRLVPGAVNRSYGIEVARLAGVPEAVIARAKEVLANLEQAELNAVGEPVIAAHAPVAAQLALFPPAPGHALAEALRALDPDTLTPLEALTLLHEWREKFLTDSA